MNPPEWNDDHRISLPPEIQRMSSTTTSSAHPPAPWHTVTTLLKLFLAALALRWGYDLLVFAFVGQGGFMIADSQAYLEDGQALVSSAAGNGLHGWAWLGPDLHVMPLYQWFVAVNVALFGSSAPLSTVMMQGLLDSGSCLLIYLIANCLNQHIATFSAIAAALNPTQIVLSGIVYNDTLFLFFVALFLFGSVSWLRSPSWTAAIMTGVGLGLAALDRVLIVPWVPVLAIFLLLTRGIVGRYHLRHVAQVVAMCAIFCVAIAPVAARNLTQYGTWSLTPQSGSHLAFWIVPLVRQAQDGTPWETGAAEMAKKVRERYGKTPTDEFTEAARYAEVSREELIKLGISPIVKAWTIGAAINLFAPAIITAPPVARMPRTGFYATEGRSVPEKIVNFLFHSDNAAYGWILLFGVAGVGAIRLIQLFGLVALLRNRSCWPIMVLFVLWSGFILAVNGPVASPKYRLPIEPVLCVLTGAGIQLLRRNHSPPHQSAA